MPVRRSIGGRSLVDRRRGGRTPGTIGKRTTTDVPESTFGGRGDVAAEPAHDAEHRRESEPTMIGLGREERIEHPRQRRPNHTGAVVTHLELPRRHARIDPRRGLPRPRSRLIRRPPRRHSRRDRSRLWLEQPAIRPRPRPRPGSLESTATPSAARSDVRRGRILGDEHGWIEQRRDEPAAPRKRQCSWRVSCVISPRRELDLCHGLARALRDRFVFSATCSHRRPR